MERGGIASAEVVLEFGAFQLYPGRRLLFRDRQPVQLGSRAIEILISLAEAGGDLVSQRELTETVWPNLFVDPSTLRVHVAALRRALSAGPDDPDQAPF